jgi:superkiller protein 3
MPGRVGAQESTARSRFEAGKYQEAVEAVASQGDEAAPSEIYLAGQSLSRLDKQDEARDAFRRLDKGDDQSAWTFIGRSAVAALAGHIDVAGAEAARAVELAPDSFHTQFQLGLVKTLANDFAGAAAAFERATEIDNQDAYAHYYAGLAYSKLRRPDQMIRHLRAFTNLAPDAPERQQVQLILRTVK